MDPNAAGLLGAAIGGGATLLAQFISGWHQRRVARDEWLRNKLAEIYEGALTTIGTHEYPTREKWLYLLLIHFPALDSDAGREFADLVRRGAVQKSDIVRLALSDARLGGKRLSAAGALQLVPRTE